MDGVGSNSQEAAAFAKVLEQNVGDTAQAQAGNYRRQETTPGVENSYSNTKSLADILRENGILPENFSFQASDKKFGKKIGKHAQDFGLDPSIPESRTQMESYMNGIVSNPSEPPRQGVWRSVGELLPDGNRAEGPVLFFRKGNDVVVTDLNGNFVTILKDGVNNARYLGAKPIL